VELDPYGLATERRYVERLLQIGVLLFRLLYVASVESTVPEVLRTVTVNVSNAVDVVVSAVVIFSQNESVAEHAPDGMVTVW